MKTIVITSAAALGLLASAALAEPVELGSAQLTDVTAGYLDGFNIDRINNGGVHLATPPTPPTDQLLDQLAALFAQVKLEIGRASQPLDFQTVLPRWSAPGRP